MQQILFLTNMEQTATYMQDALKLAQQKQEAVAGYGKADAAGGGSHLPLDGHRT